MKKVAAAVRKWVSVKLALTECFEGLFLYLHLFLDTAVTVENPLAGPTSTHIDFKLSSLIISPFLALDQVTSSQV